ncbi:MAG: hypothetical protein ACRDHB_03750, partial [Actinomycetota bacterium]
AALASSASGVAPPPRTAFAGEVSLTGAVRPPPGLALRLSAAAAAGLETVVCAGEAEPPPGIRVVRVRRVNEALRWARPLSRTGGKAVPDERARRRSVVPVST